MVHDLSSYCFDSIRVIFLTISGTSQIESYNFSLISSYHVPMSLHF